MHKPNILVVASRNAHKVQEIRSMIEPEWQVYDVGTLVHAPYVQETGSSFWENARLKAIAISQVTDDYVLSDDSGLEVDALHGVPGVYSSSFGGEEGNHELNNQKLLAELHSAGVTTPEQATARFRCVMVVARHGVELAHFEGVVDGHLLLEEEGEGGFGYDPLFVPQGFTESFAALSAFTKNSLSHRGEALRQAVAWLHQHQLDETP